MLLSICIVLFPLNKGCALFYFFFIKVKEKKAKLTTSVDHSVAHYICSK